MSIPQNFALPHFYVKSSQQSSPKYFPYRSHLAISFPITAPRDQGAREFCEEWHCFNLSLLPQSMDCDNRGFNHWFLISQADKIDVLHVVLSDEDACNRNGKLFNPYSLTPYFHYFHTLLIVSRELIVPWKPVVWNLILILSLEFSYTIHAPLHPYD